MRIPIWLLGVWLTLGGIFGAIACCVALCTIVPKLLSSQSNSSAALFGLILAANAAVSLVDLWWASRLPDSLLFPQVALRNLWVKFALGILYFAGSQWLGGVYWRPGKQAFHFLLNLFLYRSILLLAEDARKPVDQDGSGLSPWRSER